MNQEEQEATIKNKISSQLLGLLSPASMYSAS